MSLYIMPLCAVCLRFKKTSELFACDAYPKGIPEAIYTSMVDHRLPYQDDNDLQFQPTGDDAIAYADELFAEFANGAGA